MAATWRRLGERESSRSEVHNPRRPQAESARDLWSWWGERRQNSDQLLAWPACFAALQHAPRAGPARGAGPAVVDRCVQASDYCAAHWMSRVILEWSVGKTRAGRYPDSGVGGASVEGFEGNSLLPSASAWEVQFGLPMATSRRITGICSWTKLCLFLPNDYLYVLMLEIWSVKLSLNDTTFWGESIRPSFYLNPFTPESDQCQISPPAPPEILPHTVGRTWLFIACSDERWS